MPRRARSIVGGSVYHVLNRANGRLRLFKKSADFAAFEVLLAEAFERVPLRILGYTLMQNHWSRRAGIVWPRQGQHDQGFGVLSLANGHSLRWHFRHGTVGIGHVYQGDGSSRFPSKPTCPDASGLTVLGYVERNALRAKLVQKAQEWRWGSLYRRTQELTKNNRCWPIPLCL